MTTPNMIAGLINEFNTEIYTQIQQKMSAIRPFVDVVMIEKEKKELDNIGGVAFTKDNSSFVKVDSVASDISYAKRLLSSDSYKLAHKIDNTIANMLAPSSSQYVDKVVSQIVNKYQFMIDKIIYEAMDADAEAKDGSAITFATDGGDATTDLKALADFTSAKILNAKQILTGKGFGINDNSGLAWLITDMERTILEKDATVSNMDYNAGYGIQRDNDGNLKRFKGIDLVTFASVGLGEQTPFFTKTGDTLGTNYRKTFMFNTNKNSSGQSAITLGIRKENITNIFEPEEYFNTTFIKGDFNIGATRNANSGIAMIKTPVKTA